MLNVLHVVPSMSPEWGGPPVVVAEITSELAQQDVHSEIVTTHGYRVGAGQITTPGVPIFSFRTESPARLWAGYSRELFCFLDTKLVDFDLVHIHEIWHYPAYAAFCAARKYKLPYLFTIHGEISDWGLRQKALKKKIYRLCILDRMLGKASALHAITNMEKYQLNKLGFETPVAVIPNGVKSAEYNNLPDPSELVRRYPELKGKRVVLFLGRLHPKKGLDTLARSFIELAGHFDDVVLLVVGPNEAGTRESMETILGGGGSRGLLDRVIFTGLLTGKDKLAAMSCADLFVLPSHSDVLGLAVLEAMAARLPVIITDACEFPEVAANGAGLVVEIDDMQVADAIVKLLSDASLRKSMGQQGRKLVDERYTWRASAIAMSRLYTSLVSHHAS